MARPPAENTTTTQNTTTTNTGGDGGLTDAQIMAMIPGIPWGALTPQNRQAAISAFRNAVLSGQSPDSATQAMWGVLRHDPHVQATIPDFEEWASHTGRDANDWHQVSAYHAWQADAQSTFDGAPDSIKHLFTASEIGLLRSGAYWKNSQLFNFFQWVGSHYNDYTYYNVTPTREKLWSDWQTQTPAHTHGQDTAESASASAAAQAASDARAEALRRQHIQDAAQKILQGYSDIVKTMFTPAELMNAAIWQAGGEWGDAHMAQEIALFGDINPFYVQFTGQNISRQQLDARYQAGDTPEKVKGELGGASWAQANASDVGFYTGNFGAAQGAFNAQQQQQLGQNEMGYQTPQGMELQNQFEKAVQRARTSFQGVLAHFANQNPFGQTPQQRPPDIQA